MILEMVGPGRGGSLVVKKKIFIMDLFSQKQECFQEKCDQGAYKMGV